MKFREFKSMMKDQASLQVPYHQEFVEKMSLFEIDVTEKASYTPYIRKIVLSFSSFVVILVAFFGYLTSLRVVDIVTIDVNPSIEININPFGRVVSVVPQNQDAIELVAQLDHQKGDLGTILIDIYESSIELGYTSSDNTFLLLGIDSKSYESELSISDKINSIYIEYPITMLSLSKHSAVEYVYYSGFVDDSRAEGSNYESIFAQDDILSTTTMIDQIPDATDTPAYDSEYYASKIAEFEAMSSEDFTDLAQSLDISEAKLQLVLSIFFYYPQYQIQSGIVTLSEMSLQTLIPLYNAIP